MHRYTPLPLCYALSAAVVAAPAPFPKAWVTGWDKPVDPKGDCRFGREGEKLTIEVGGKDHFLHVEKGRLDAPRLLRDVEGDFAVQVRASVPPMSGEEYPGFRAAGLMLTDGKSFARLELKADGFVRIALGKLHEEDRPNGGCVEDTNLGNRVPLHLRLERRGNQLTTMWSADGVRWKSQLRWVQLDLPRKVKVGVVGEALASGTFQVVFDEFQLIPLGGR